VANYRFLINDTNLPVALAAQLLSRGYYAVPCGSGEDGKGWIAAGNDVSITKPDDHGNAPPISDVLAIFERHPGCGISVAVPYLRNSSDVLLAIDVDVRDQNTLDKVALVVGMPCPVKRGARGATFFVRARKAAAVDSLLKQRDIPIPKILDKNGRAKNSVQSGKIGSDRWEHEYIDILGTANRHSILPPSLHHQGTQLLGRELYYEWIKFPGSEIILKLEETDPSDLPLFEEPHLLLLFQLAKNLDSPIWRFLGQTSKGNFHELMLEASLYLWHEKFTADEIVYICETEAYRSCEDESHYSERRTAIRNSVKTLASKYPEQKPAKTKSAKASKVPMDRLAADWLKTQFQKEDVGSFNGSPYYWHDSKWTTMVDALCRNPVQPLRERIQIAFPGAGRNSTSSAVEDFLDWLPVRRPQPDQFLVPFVNGVVDVRTLSLRPEARDDYVLAHIPHPFEADRACPLYDKFITDLMLPPAEYLDTDCYEADHTRAIETLEEFLGYCLVASHEFRNMLFLVGKTSTGKSEMVKLIKALLPADWVSDVAMSLLDDPNAVMSMANSHVNISGEIGRHNKDVDTALLKITSGEPIPLKLLYKDRFNGVVSARMLFHGNLPPDTTDSTGAISKRMILLRTTDVPPTEEIPEYHRLLLKEAPGILNRWIAAYARLQERGRFEPPNYSKLAVRQATEEANSVASWMANATEKTEIGEGSPNADLFLSYREYCEAGKLYCYSIIQWGKLLTASGFPTRLKRVAGNKVVNYRTLKLVNEMVRY